MAEAEETAKAEATAKAEEGGRQRVLLEGLPLPAMPAAAAETAAAAS